MWCLVQGGAYDACSPCVGGVQSLLGVCVGVPAFADASAVRDAYFMRSA